MNEKKEVLFNIEDIYRAYNDCIKHKRSSKDYLEYELKYGKDDLFTLLDEINSRTYKVWKSYTFIAKKPKLREIFAASFRDRIVHHLVVSILEPYFEKRFIKNVFSCRMWKWALLWVKTLFKDLQKLSKLPCHYPAWLYDSRSVIFGLDPNIQENRSPCQARGWQYKETVGWQEKQNYYYLQMDIKSFFMSIDKDILFEILNKHLTYKNFPNYLLLRYLVKEIIYNDPTILVEKRWDKTLFWDIPYWKSLFHLHWKNCWLPIWNLTSQFFANVYLNELDKFIKKDLKTKYYYRYVDDFILLWNRQDLQEKLIKIKKFLLEKLFLQISDKKTKLLPINYDIDFIWYILRDTKYLLPRKRNINTFKQVVFKENVSNKKELNHTFSAINSHIWHLKNTKTFSLRKNHLNNLNQVIFSNIQDFKKIIKNEKIYNLLDNQNKKPMKKYKEIQTKYPWYVLLFQIGCFYKTFDMQAIFLSEQLWLKLTIFNPKTTGERIMCWFHEKSIEKYKNLIKDKQVNTIFLKQIKQNNWEITREIYEILEFENPEKIPIYKQEDIQNIKQNFYKTYFDNKKIVLKETVLSKEQEFLQDFKKTDFSKKNFYELVEYIINWKKIIS